ncbi:MAG TPA: FtsX-like permease family protein, partial [Acidimicrobiales bacterium]
GRGAQGLGRLIPVLAVSGGACAIAALVTVGLVRHSVDEVAATPRAFGADWDYEIAEEPDDPAAVLSGVMAEDSVDALALLRGASFNNVVAQLGELDTLVQPVTLENLQGEITPLLDRGRPAVDANDVVIGAAVARALGAGVGDELRVTANDAPPERFEISGIGRLADGDDTDRTFFVTNDGMARLLAPDAEADVQGAMLRLTGGAALDDRVRIEALGFKPVRPPSSVENLQEMGDVPSLVAWALVVMGTVAVTHALVMGARRARRDLAVARALGFTRSEVTATSRWQAGALVAAVVLVGVPAGIVVGRLVWGRMATGVSVDALVVIPWPLIVLAPVVAILAGMALAEVVGRHSARLRAAAVLRDE